MSKQFKLSPEEATVILRTNDKNVDAMTKRLLQKVVDKRALSDDEIGELEGIVVNHRLVESAKGMDLDAHHEPAKNTVNTRESFRRIEEEIGIAARRQMIMEFRTQHPPLTVREIAKRMAISTDTVMKDIKGIREKHTRILDGSQTMRILGQTCEQYDILYGKAMALGEQYTSPMAKAAFLRTAIAALDSKSKLMGETGIIHRVPQQQEILVAHADAGTVRQRVAKLITAQEQRTSPMLNIAAEPPAEPLPEDPRNDEDHE